MTLAVSTKLLIGITCVAKPHVRANASAEHSAAIVELDDLPCRRVTMVFSDRRERNTERSRIRHPRECEYCSQSIELATDLHLYVGTTVHFKAPNEMSCRSS